ncbi:hypothetical protein AVEN_36631-1 [Araneus ventricosus]|uniref:Uncharacterized protein n=1 Tax=Araneus ventricosus TaxID=182803 RepID=A0A4Y2L9Q1_ARAVE|nr:hypothetical protein AVEN_36631-1 [Araneus ventricosus]
MYSPQLYRSDSRYNSRSYYRIFTKLVSMEMSRGGTGFDRNFSRRRNLLERFPSTPVSPQDISIDTSFSSRHFHRHQFLLDTFPSTPVL